MHKRMLATLSPEQGVEYLAALARIKQREAEMVAQGRDPLMALAGAWEWSAEEEAQFLAEIEEMRHFE